MFHYSTFPSFSFLFFRSRNNAASATSSTRMTTQPLQHTTTLSQPESTTMVNQSWNVQGSTSGGAGDPHQATLRIAFDKYDVDKDGLISFVDLRTRFRDMGRTNVPDVEIRRWIADKDRRGKGNVNFEEFRRAYSHVVTAVSRGGGGARLGGTVSSSDVRSSVHPRDSRTTDGEGREGRGGNDGRNSRQGGGGNR